MELTVLGQDLEAPAPTIATATAAGCTKSACGTAADGLAHLPEAVRRKVENHPCYSEEAHHHYARMHVAVAPACNIQCHYCNRKYDCANESRPGVVSEVLTPDQAVHKVKAVAAAIPQMTVLGVAGPGDPLANPGPTFETFRRLKAEAPDLKLCVSTNGLALPDHVDELAELGVDHVTITINCLDPEIGAKIYPWIFWDHRRVRGRRAAEILIARQQSGLEKLVARGILVKVNSVMIPGVNDRHLAAVSKAVKAKGAFLHNVMPLIAEAEHGTFYGVMGQRSPTRAELEALQDACSGDMAMMRHCRQCRADAVGLLGEDRGAEFTLDRVDDRDVDYAAAMTARAAVHADIEDRRAAARRAASPPPPVLATARRPVKMAVASSGDGLVDLHFGHVSEFLVYEASPAGVRFVGLRRVERTCNGPDACDDGLDAIGRVIAALEDCETVLCAKVGFGPWQRLEAAGIQPHGEHAYQPIEGAVAAVYREMAAAGRLAITPPSTAAVA